MRPPASLLPCLLPSLLLLLLSASPALARVLQGVEFGCAPFCNADLVGQGDGRAWVSPYNTSQSVPVDASGWPTADFFAVIYDERPAFAWAPPEDDPWGWSAPLSGSYYMNFSGFATIAAEGDPGMKGVTIVNVTTDATSTAGWIVIPPGVPNLLVLNFTSTRRSAGAALGSGVTSLRIMLPGQAGAPAGGAAWAAQLLASLAPFDHLRVMGITGTNSQAGYYGDPGHHALEWSDRCLPADAQWPSSLRAGCWGMPWEHVVRLSQASSKGLWVNLPVSATLSEALNTSTYAYQWAQLLKSGSVDTGGSGVPAGVPIYVEHSNEVCAAPPPLNDDLPHSRPASRRPFPSRSPAHPPPPPHTPAAPLSPASPRIDPP